MTSGEDCEPRFRPGQALSLAGRFAGTLAIAILALGEVAAEEDESTSFHFDQVAVESLLPILADHYKVNLVLSGHLPGTVTVSIENRELRLVLEDILLGTGYTYHLTDDILRVLPDTLTIATTIPLGTVDAVAAKEDLLDIAGDAELAADRATNSLSAVGPAADVRRIEDALRLYDVRPRQVQILGQMIEINLVDSRSLGIDWSGKWDDEYQTLTGQTRVSGPDLGTLTLNYTRLTTTELTTVLAAILANTDSKVISRPVLVTVNSEESKILVGERVPFTRFTVETTTGAVQEEVDFVDVGVRLEVTPLITEDSLIVLQVTAEISEVLDKEVQGIPRIGTREAHTRVAVHSGETAVIGGLRKEQELEETTGVPFLASIPYLGRLFRHESTRITQTELLIFLTPTVLGEREKAPFLFPSGLIGPPDPSPEPSGSPSTGP